MTYMRRTPEIANRDDGEATSSKKQCMQGAFRCPQLCAMKKFSVGVCFICAIACFLIFQTALFWKLPTSASSKNHVLDGLLPRGSNTGARSPHHEDDASAYTSGYDIVTLVHHDDMDTWLRYGIKSWIRHIVLYSPDAHIYAIASPKAFEAITQAKQRAQQQSDADATFHNNFERVIPVRESRFPFTANETTRYEDKPTWVYQQLLKIYAYQVLLSSAADDPNIPRIKQLFLIMDSDTVVVRPFPFLTNAGGDGRARPIYSVASVASGAFSNDAAVGKGLVAEVFDKTIPKAFPDHNGHQFTAITHQMMIDGPIIMDMVSTIERLHDGKLVAWRFLCKLRYVLSEWELYMAWIMKHHRQDIAVKQIPYVNWGTCTDEKLDFLRNQRDVFYLTKHDNWGKNHICCVNSNTTTTECKCCPAWDCEQSRITCKVLGIEGCRQWGDEGIMQFAAVS